MGVKIIRRNRQLKPNSAVTGEHSSVQCVELPMGAGLNGNLLNEYPGSQVATYVMFFVRVPRGNHHLDWDLSKPVRWGIGAAMPSSALAAPPDRFSATP